MTQAEVSRYQDLKKLSKCLRSKKTDEKEEADLKRCEHEMREIEGYVQHIQSPVEKAMVTQHYIKGESWLRVSIRFGACDESYARNRVRRFFKKQKQSGLSDR